MTTPIARAKEFISTGIWDTDTSTLGASRAFLVNSIRFLSIAAREYSQGQLNFRAMSLVYTTLLSLVPLLAVVFSVLKGFGVYNQMEPVLFNVLAPLGPSAGELTKKIIGFVGNMKVGVLGSIGLAMLMYTVLSVIGKMEDALNYFWRVRKPRTLARRFSDYMSVLLVGPILIFAAIGLTGAVKSATLVQKVLSIGPLGFVFYIASLLLPYLTTCVAFAFTYMFLPSVKVRIPAALAGGLVGGIIWQVSGWAFASFIASSAQYSAVYSGFAIVVLFMMWTYYSWLVFLVGAMASFYYQNPQYLSLKTEALRLGGRLREKAALAVMYLIGQSFHKGDKPWTADGLAGRLGLPLEPVYELVGALMNKGLLVETGEADEARGLMPARDMDAIPLFDVLECARGAGDGKSIIEREDVRLPELGGISGTLEDALKAAVSGRTVRDLVSGGL